MTKIINTENAKQGRSGNRILTVLVVSVTLALVAWAIAEFYGQLIHP